MPRGKGLWLVIAALWLLMLGAAYFLARYGRFGGIDFEAYYLSAQNFASGVNPYGIVGREYLYPPLLAQLLMPIAALFDFGAAWHLWFAFNIALLLGALALFARHVPPTRRKAVWAAPLLFWPIVEGLVIGQITIVLLVLFVAAWVSIKAERRALAGALLAFAAWLKAYPALLIVYFVWKRDWRVVLGAVIGGAALLVMQIAVSGIDPLIMSFRVMFDLTRGAQPHLLVSNSSIFGFTAQLFDPTPVIQPLIDSPALQLLSRILLTLAALVALLWLSRRAMAQTSSERFDLEYAHALLTALLLSPTLWVAGLIPLLLAYGLVWQRTHGRLILWFCVLSFVVLSLFWLFALGYTGEPPQNGLFVAWGFYTLAALWGVLVYRLSRKP